MSDDLKARFEAAAAAVQSLDSRPSDDELLELYSLYKQATAGNVEGERPGMFDFAGRAKYDAWATLEGMSSDAAMTAYIEKVEALK